MKNKRLAVLIAVFGLVLIVLAALPYSEYNWRAVAGYVPPSGNPDLSPRVVGDPLDYYDLPYQYLYPISVFKFEQFGTFTVSANNAGGEDAMILCWSGGKWSDTHVENFRYDPVTNTVTFKVIVAPSICALFSAE